MNKVSWHPGCFDDVYSHGDMYHRLKRDSQKTNLSSLNSEGYNVYYSSIQPNVRYG